ncbi:MAG: hypothetical protein H6732_10180 [Alphaproteobacteria bacterium]|nr:hypothetical protein [Alphaproteobacteria bacterium]
MRWLAAVVFALSCAPAAPECTSTTECGDFQACVAGFCEDVDCRSSKDCGLETFCSLETHACEPGCATSDDCFVGDRCDPITSTCVQRTCANTQLDCALGERCDAATGTCQQDPAPHCKRCRRSDQCGPTGICAATSEFATTGHCFLECSPEAFDPCPAGLQCSGSPEGGFHCVGACEGL